MMKVEDMQADIDFFYEKLLSTHPYPFIILSQDEWKEKIDSLKTSITQPLTKKDFYFKISELNSYLDLHTSIHPSKKAYKKIQRAMNYPIFSQKGDTVYVINENKEECRLLSVGGNTPKEIERIFFERESKVEPMYNPTFLNMLRSYCKYNFVEDSIAYTYISSTGKETTSYLCREKKSKSASKKNKNNTGTALEIDTVSSSALMTVNTFYPKSISDFRDSISSYIKKLNEKKVQRLYIDITSNSGGLVNLTGYLAGFFIEKTGQIYAGTWTSKASKERDKQRFDFLIRNGELGDYTQRKYTFYAENSKPKFSGEIFVVQSRNSYSAAAIYASLMQYYTKNCTIIGEEGEIKAFYADPMTLTLPKSKFMVSMSSMFGRFVGKDKNRGVVPDIPYKIYDPTKHLSLKELNKIVEENKNNNNKK
ncbi:MAG: hypothetical protein IJ748_02360 [Bacteroidales bacterium]|nr:hypothetical protein [Bacteroidales bacterium]